MYQDAPDDEVVVYDIQHERQAVRLKITPPRSLPILRFAGSSLDPWTAAISGIRERGVKRGGSPGNPHRAA
jgi:hypothetical protein